MEEIEDDPSSEMLAIELYSPAVYAARTFDLLYGPYLRYLPYGTAVGTVGTVGTYRSYGTVGTVGTVVLRYRGTVVR